MSSILTTQKIAAKNSQENLSKNNPANKEASTTVEKTKLLSTTLVAENPIYKVNPLTFIASDPKTFTKTVFPPKPTSLSPNSNMNEKIDTSHSIITFEALETLSETYIRDLESPEVFLRDDSSFIVSLRQFIKSYASDWLSKTIITNDEVIKTTAKLLIKYDQYSKNYYTREKVQEFLKEELENPIFMLIVKNIKDERKKENEDLSSELKDVLKHVSMKVKKHFPDIKEDFSSKKMIQYFLFDTAENEKKLIKKFGEPLFNIISENIGKSLNDDSKTAMPKELRNYLITLNLMLKKKFPQADTESLVFQSFIFRFVFNNLLHTGTQIVEKNDIFAQWAPARNKVIDYLKRYVIGMQKLPETLNALFQKQKS